MKYLCFVLVLFFSGNFNLLAEKQDGSLKHKDLSNFMLFPNAEDELRLESEDWSDFARKGGDLSGDLKLESEDWSDFAGKGNDLSEDLNLENEDWSDFAGKEGDLSEDLDLESENWSDFAAKGGDLSEDLDLENEDWSDFAVKGSDLSEDLNLENEDWSDFAVKGSDLSENLNLENEDWLDFWGKKRDFPPETPDYYDDVFSLFGSAKEQKTEIGENSVKGFDKEANLDFLGPRDDFEKQDENLENKNLFNFLIFPPVGNDERYENKGWQKLNEKDDLSKQSFEYYDESLNLYINEDGFKNYQKETDSEEFLLPNEDKSLSDILDSFKSENQEEGSMNNNNPFGAYEEKEPPYYMLLFPPKDDKNEVDPFFDDALSSLMFDKPRETKDTNYNFDWLRKPSGSDDGYFSNTNQDVNSLKDEKEKNNINFIYLIYYIINTNDKNEVGNSDISNAIDDNDIIGNSDIINVIDDKDMLSNDLHIKDKVGNSDMNDVLDDKVGNSDLSDVSDDNDEADESDMNRALHFENFLKGKYVDSAGNVYTTGDRLRQYVNRSRMFAISTLLVICSIVILGFCLLCKIIAAKRARYQQKQNENYQLLNEAGP